MIPDTTKECDKDVERLRDALYRIRSLIDAALLNGNIENHDYAHAPPFWVSGGDCMWRWDGNKLVPVIEGRIDQPLAVAQFPNDIGNDLTAKGCPLGETEPCIKFVEASESNVGTDDDALNAQGISAAEPAAMHHSAPGYCQVCHGTCRFFLYGSCPL